MKKKLLPILLVVVIVFNFIFCNMTYADDAKSNNNRYGGNSTLGGETVKETSESGRDSDGHEFKQENSGPSILGLVMQSIALVVNALPMSIHGIMSLITYNRNKHNRFCISNDNARFSIYNWKNCI